MNDFGMMCVALCCAVTAASGPKNGDAFMQQKSLHPLSSVVEELNHAVSRLSSDLGARAARSFRFAVSKEAGGGASTAGVSVGVRVVSDGDPKPKECLACESVITTWREQFPCVGLAEPEWTPESMIEMPACPWVTNCGFFGDGDLGNTCRGMKEQMKIEAEFTKVYQTIEKKKNDQALASKDNTEDKNDNGFPDIFANNKYKFMFEVCKDLGHCEKEAFDCRKMLLGSTCRNNPSCAASSLCPASCFSCYWLLLGWFPMFQRPNQDPESSPDGYGNCYGLPPPPLPSGTAFLELSSAATPANAVEGIGSPALVETRGKADVLVDCLPVWETFATDPKARYFASYLTELGSFDWNANTACRCLQMCPYDSFEAFDLMEACEYQSSEARQASLFPDLLLQPYK